MFTKLGLNSYKHKDNTQTIEVRYSFKGKPYQINTGVKVEYKNWDSKNQRIIPKDSPKNAHIQQFKNEVENIILQYFNINKEKPPFEYIQQKLKPKEGNDAEDTLLKHIKEYVENKKNIVSKESLKDYNSFLNTIIEFQERLGETVTFNSVNKKLLEQYYNYLVEVRKLKNNTVYNRFKTFKAVMNYYLSLGYHSNTAHSDFRIKGYEVEVITLTKNEIQLLKDHNPKNERLQKVKDLFLFGAFTGLRFGDLKKLDKNHFVNGFLRFQANKTKQKIEVPLNHTAKEIIEKYDYQLPKLSNQKFNNYLKELFYGIPYFRDVYETKYSVQGSNEVSETYPKYQLITSHVMRKTFVTLLLEQGVPYQNIMKWSGHQDLAVFRKYLNKKQNEIEHMQLMNEI